MKGKAGVVGCVALVLSAAAIVAGLAIRQRALDRISKVSNGPGSFVSQETPGSQASSSETDPPPEIREELLSRVKSFFGSKGFSNIEESFVIVVGLGGVGACVEMQSGFL